jgi:hypothetical protein
LVAADSELLAQREKRGEQHCPDRERERDDREQRVETHTADYPTAAGQFHGPALLAVVAVVEAGWLVLLAYLAFRLVF